MKEALRLFPSVAAIGRRLGEDVRLGKKKGEVVQNLPFLSKLHSDFHIAFFRTVKVT